ncbi:MAG: PD40 domain-containing protein [Verrucomicrobiales bacterium]|nr:PD40 domain-containing protein [Verrucomicrobiales bacterium]
MKSDRRQFLGRCGAAASFLTLAGCRTMEQPRSATEHVERLFFTSQGRTAIINADGSGLRYFDFHVPDQVTWQPGPFLSDGRRVIFLSMEARRDGPGRPFDKYYHQTPTHLWLHDLERDALTEICARERLAVFYTPALLVSDERLLVQVVRDSGGQIFSMNLDGSDAREFTRLGEGLPYGLSLSPDGHRVAYHLASPQGYQIWTSNVDGADRVRVAAHPDRLYFGPTWSPDGAWLLFQSCHFKTDPGHDWSDLCLARPDGGDFRLLTEGQVMWFGATYGNPRNRGGGSNVAGWTRDGRILFPRRLPESKVPWEFQAQRPDTDHFNRDFKPELARGGTEICRLNPNDGSMARLTQSDPPVWDFRAGESPTGRQIVFCRARTGDAPALYVMGADGRSPRLLTRGWDGQGADHPRWLPLVNSA